MTTNDQNISGLARIRAALDMPLTEAIRPQSFAEYIGQDHLLNAENGAIANYLRLGYLPSMVLSGPPGVGKTSLARLLAAEAHYVFVELSATASTVSDLKDLSGSIDAENQKRHRQKNPRLRVLVFIDEIHRFSVVQQDFLLPFIERGSFVFVGATTADPEKRVRRAILSRCHVFKLTGLADRHLEKVARRAVLFDNIRQKVQKKRSFLTYTDEAIDAVVKYASGDMRSAVNLIEILGVRVQPGGGSKERANSMIQGGIDDTVIDTIDDTVIDTMMDDTMEVTAIGETTVNSFIQTLNKARFGLNSEQNLPLLAHLLRCLRHPQKPVNERDLHVKHENLKNGINSPETPKNHHNAPDSDSDLESWVDDSEPLPYTGSDPKLMGWAEHMVLSDDDTSEPGPIYSDDNILAPDFLQNKPQLSLKNAPSLPISASKFRIVSATHACLQLFKRGESPLCILKYLILFTCTHARPEENDLIKVLAVLKAVEKTGINGEQLLFNCIERLAGRGYYEQTSLRESVETARKYAETRKLAETRNNSETTGKSPEEISLNCEVVFDTELAEKLLQDIPEKSEKQCLGMPIVALEHLGSDYILGEGIDLKQPHDQIRDVLHEKLHS